MRALPLLAGALGLTALAIVSWNASRFYGIEQKPRSKDLDFLPSPAAARLVALGHTNTAAKLRWIDSFAYFQYQLERRDDSIGPEGESGFNRLYEMLIGLDPRFQPYYEHASLNLGGVLGHDLQVQQLLNLGLLNRPHDTRLWRMLASELAARSHLEQTNPRALDGFLDQWAAAETSLEGKQTVWEWKRAMALRTRLGLGQIAYWEEHLRSAPPGSPTRTFITETIRELLARGGIEQLETLLKRWKETRHFAPVLITDLIDQALLADCYPSGIHPLAPLQIANGTLVLAADPFGYPYRLVDGRVQSLGLEALKARKFAALHTDELEAAAKRLGHWPATLEEAQAAGVQLPPMAAGLGWRLNGHTIEAMIPPPPYPAWEPRK